MREHYQIDGGFAKVMQYPEDEATLIRLNVNPLERGQGVGTKLMLAIMDDADREGVVLLLTSGIGRSTGLSTEELRDWYTRLGFDAIAVGSSPGTTLMQRVPRVREGSGQA